MLSLVKNIKDARKEKNQDLIDRMKNGEQTSLYSPQATWWQPREIIKKDLAIIERLNKNKSE